MDQRSYTLVMVRRVGYRFAPTDGTLDMSLFEKELAQARLSNHQRSVQLRMGAVAGVSLSSGSQILGAPFPTDVLKGRLWK